VFTVVIESVAIIEVATDV